MHKFDPQIHHRRNIRLSGFDYSQTGLFFITICVQHRKCLFGEILNGLEENDFDGTDLGLRENGMFVNVLCEKGMRDRAMRDRAPTRGVILNAAGEMVKREWLLLPQRFPGIKLHEYIIMPNHFHGIIETVGAPLVGAQPRIPDQISSNSKSNIPDPTFPQTNQNKHIGQIIGAFKSCTTDAYIAGVKDKNWPEFENRLWQRNYWEHIIRTPEAYQNISNYIINNPQTWLTDSLQPELPSAS